MPERIQLSRRKGWRKPANTMSVARPGRWGNPFTVELWGLETSLALFKDTARGIWNPLTLAAAPDEQIREAYYLAAHWNDRLGGHPIEVARTELAGKNLACWCPLDQPCHADVLLDIANGANS